MTAAHTVQTVECPEELTSQQRSAILVYHFVVYGAKLTTQECADLIGLTERGALYLLDILSSTHGLPLAKIDGRWMMLVSG
jgi:hypothetical protein